MDSPAAGMATGMAKMLNGASPGARQTFHFAAAAASDGNWQISPTKLHAPITALEFQSMTKGPVDIPVTGCAVDFDLTQPGLAQSVACSFVLPADTYTGAGPKFDTTFDLTIDDSFNGFYTDPAAGAKITTTAPAGGGQPITLPNPRGPGGTGVQQTRFDMPLVVNDGDTVTVSMMFNALQAFQISINGGVPALGVDSSGNAGFCDTVTAVGQPAAIAFYVNPVLGTAYSYNLSQIGMQNPLSVSVLYTNSMQPGFLGDANGNLPGCGPFNVGFVFPGKGNGYLGLDSSGVLGWAGLATSGATSTVVAVMRMPQAATKGATTTFDCLNTTTDPMPAGDSFSSGAPVISSPTYTATMTLVAN
jgi:hypothetical protein